MAVAWWSYSGIKHEKGARLSYTNEVTEEFLRQFKEGDSVDVRVMRRTAPGRSGWSGPHTLVAYKMDPPMKDAKPAAYIEVDLGEGKKLGRRLIVGDQQVIRIHRRHYED